MSLVAEGAGKPRVCLVTDEYPPLMGGVGRSVRRLAEYLVAAGFGVHVVVLLSGRRTRAIAPGSREEGGVILHFQRLETEALDPLQGLTLRRNTRQAIGRLDAEVGFDLFHGIPITVVDPLISVAAEAGNGRRRPVIASIRGSDGGILIDNPLFRPFLLRSLQQATWVTSVSRAYLERAKEEVELEGRCSVIRNGVEATPADCRWRLDSCNQGVVGTVGEFRMVKDIPLLIRGYAGVDPRQRRRLLLAGYFGNAREEERWSQVLITELGIRDQVTLTGRFEPSEVGRHLRAMNVYVQSSSFEGLPNALLEAASLGLPLVATAVGGMKEILRHGENALVVPHGDPQPLSEAIGAVLGNRELARRLSAGALRLAARWSMEAERDSYLALYRLLLERRSADAGRSG